MAEKDRYYGLVKWQKALTWLIVAAFGISILAYVLDHRVGVIFYAASVIILILSGPVRLVWISFYFRREGDRNCFIDYSLDGADEGYALDEDEEINHIFRFRRNLYVAGCRQSRFHPFLGRPQ
jgi:hypothetical protein